MMDRRTFVASSGGVLILLAPNLRVRGQGTTRRIGFLSAFTRASVEELRPELEKLGWTDGRNIVLLEPRTADGRYELLPTMARELVSQGPDLILVMSIPATRALMQATKSIPIVMIGVGHPVEYGLIADYKKPGGNVTGSSYPADESARKLLQLLKEAAPRLRSVALFINPSNEATAALVKQMRSDTMAQGMHAQVVEVLGPGDFAPAFAAIRSANTQSILLIPEPLISSNRGAIADFAQTHGLPLASVGDSRNLPPSGLIAFGPALLQYAQITARYVDRILKGANPGDLAVEQPTRFELVINLKTAKALGLTIPQSLLLRADEVIQ
jgi:putative ABC transport system substrate-binding protein